jgi:rfaE bifunctional protein kinase chain/domain
MVSSDYIHQIFDKFPTITVTVAGDIMSDNYIEGRVERISPEAPVPVVEVTKKHSRPGGAGNVAINLKSLGAKVNLCAITGDDENGKTLTQNLFNSGINTGYIHHSKNRITSTKTRVLGNHIQMLRIDEEQTDFLSNEDESICQQFLMESIQASDALLFEDYDKGYLTQNLIKKGTELALAKEIPVTVDPKIRNFFGYPDVTLFKPNLKELKTGLQTTVNPYDAEDLKKASGFLRERLNHKYTLITLSEAGIYGEEKQSDFQIPAHLRNIADVSGAGDTVIAVATLCLAAGADFRFAAALSNLAGGMACEYPGVVPINRENLLNEALRLLVG